MAEQFDSSDSARHSRPLKYAKTFTSAGPMKLELGGTLPQVQVAYETYGRLNAARDNAVLLCHALSGDSHVAQHQADDDQGWWDIAVGPGKAIDTDRWFVVCPNILGGCRGTTGPNSANPETGKPYGRDFPTITIADMVEAQRLLVDSLGIEKLRAVIGGSMGGHQALTWAKLHGGRVRGLIPMATSPRLTSQALAFDVVGRNAILRDPNFHGGRYYERGTTPAVGLAIARMIGHITYLSREAMREKFEATRHQPRDVPTAFEKRFSVGSYLGYQGDKFVERFDANSYVALSMAMDMFDLGRTKEELAKALSPAEARWLVISFTSDWLFPPEQSRQLVDALIAAGRPVSYANLTSSCGHDAFLLPNDLDRYGPLLSSFLTNLDEGASSPKAGAAPGRRGAGQRRTASGDQGRNTAGAGIEERVEEVDEDDPTSIFHGRRLDYDRIVDLIPPGASVLDLGCGSGGLLARLRRRGRARTVGAELDEREIVRCVGKGLDVVHMDLNAGLASFSDGQFDCVVLSQTLQTIRDVAGVLADMLRVGRRCIVSFPNFAYHKLRKMLAEEGRAPESPGLLRHSWYDSPNIRFLSIEDFRSFCRQKGIRIEKEEFLDTESGSAVTDDPNRNADLAIVVITR